VENFCRNGIFGDKCYQIDSRIYPKNLGCLQSALLQPGGVSKTAKYVFLKSMLPFFFLASPQNCSISATPMFLG